MRLPLILMAALGIVVSALALREQHLPHRRRLPCSITNVGDGGHRQSQPLTPWWVGVVRRRPRHLRELADGCHWRGTHAPTAPCWRPALVGLGFCCNSPTSKHTILGVWCIYAFISLEISRSSPFMTLASSSDETRKGKKEKAGPDWPPLSSVYPSVILVQIRGEHSF